MNEPRVNLDAYKNYGDSWIQTFTGTGLGGVMPLESPSESDVNFISIAHHLACTNRYIGATRVPLSIAQHSIEIADRLPEHLRGHGLFHDGHEHAVNDTSTPYKRVIETAAGKPIIAEIEARHDAAIHAAAGLLYPLPEADKKILKWEDLRALATERRDLSEESPATWLVDSLGAQPWPERIEAWPWWYAEIIFLSRLAIYAPGAFERQWGEIIARRSELERLAAAEHARLRRFTRF